jgi:hypothetical protein
VHNISVLATLMCIGLSNKTKFIDVIHNTQKLMSQILEILLYTQSVHLLHYILNIKNECTNKQILSFPCSLSENVLQR